MQKDNRKVLKGNASGSHVIPTSCLLPFLVKIALAGLEGPVLIPKKYLTDCQQLLSVSQGLCNSELCQPGSTAAGLFPSGKSLQQNGLIQVIKIKRRNAEQERDFED